MPTRPCAYCATPLCARLAAQAHAVARARHDPALIVARTLEIYRAVSEPARERVAGGR